MNQNKDQREDAELEDSHEESSEAPTAAGGEALDLEGLDHPSKCKMRNSKRT